MSRHRQRPKTGPRVGKKVLCRLCKRHVRIETMRCHNYEFECAGRAERTCQQRRAAGVRR